LATGRARERQQWTLAPRPSRFPRAAAIRRLPDFRGPEKKAGDAHAGAKFRARVSARPGCYRPGAVAERTILRASMYNL